VIFLLAPLAQADPSSFEVGSTDGGGTQPGTTQPNIGAIPQDILVVAERVSGQPLPQRMGAISAALLGRPYVSDPMGEGAGADADPFARYDAFDCLTFVEEVLALSLALDPAHAASVRDSLRYGDGPRDYVHRRHFMELQWLPGTIGDGWLRDTTAEYGAVTLMEKDVTLENTWKWWSGRKKFAHTDTELPVGQMRLEVLELDEAARVAASVRPGSIILTVRKDKPGVPLWITHVSMTVPTDKGVMMRHATKIGGGGTRDHGLGWYVEHLRTYKNWPVLGISILEPVEQGARLSAIASAAP
jgi:hypothetical protein